MSFQISPELDANKVFLVRSSELEGRLDPFCYVPDLVELDRKIKAKTKHTLKDFTLFRASGATPKKDADDYYSDKEKGIPFIRVQNLSVTGELDTSDLVYIAKEVHEGMLKRSQVKAHDLLVKITGVGRMAVASVVPDGFEGNINQHIVIIRTESKETSQNLAAFLNLDSIEKIASKRATGGTRPALDYAALFSIPVINRREVYEIINQAVSFKRAKEAEAQRLLDSIDDYLLGELGIELPEQEENTIQSRIFTRRFSEISGGRLAPDFHAPYYKHFEKLLYKSKFEIKKLSEISNRIFQGVGRKLTDNQEYTLLKVKNILKNNVIDLSDTEFVDLDDKNKILKSGDIISPFIGEAIKQYKFSVYNHSGNYTVDNNTGVIRLKRAAADPLFVSAVMMSSIGRWQLRQLTGGGGVPFLGSFNAKKLQIPLPPLPVQTEIADHIAQIRSRAKQLQQEAVEGLEQAKLEVETMLLGDCAETL